MHEAYGVMQNEHIGDSWVLPSRQGEYPGRPVLGAALVHRRRERTFLVLATLFVTATAAMVILGTSRVIDINYAVSSVFPDIALPFDLALPFGALAFPVALLAATLVCELYGRKRANALVVMGLFASLALAGVMYAADQLDGVDVTFGSALAFTACYLVAHLSNLVIFDALRRSMDGRHPLIRKTLATVFAQVGGWAAFAFVAYGYSVYVSGKNPDLYADWFASLALGSALFVAAVALVDLVPFGIARRSLVPYLRVATDGDEIVDEVIELEPRAPAFVVRAPVQPAVNLRTTGELNLRTTGERRFFTEGEELSDPR